MKFGSVEVKELGNLKIGDLVNWSEKEISISGGLEYVEGKITHEGDHLSILVKEWEDDGTHLGNPAVAYVLNKKRLDNIKLNNWNNSK